MIDVNDMANDVRNFLQEAQKPQPGLCGCSPQPAPQWQEEEGNKNNNNSQSQNTTGTGSSQPKQTGSYTNTHATGKTYNGKGSRNRSQASGKRIEKQTGDKHTATDWTPSANGREAFKDESHRIDANGGANSSSNHNQIESPGKNYRKEDVPK